MKILNEKLEKIKVLSGNSIKIIAVVAMLIDHIAKIVLVWYLYTKVYPNFELGIISQNIYDNLYNLIYVYMIGIGRLAFPIFCFLLVEGFIHTKNIKKYSTLVFIFALISEIPFDLAFFHKTMQLNGNILLYFGYQNVLFTMFLGILMLVGIKSIDDNIIVQRKKQNDNKKQKNFIRYIEIIKCILKISVIILTCYLAQILNVDYGYLGILYIAFIYLFKEFRIVQAISIPIIYMICRGVNVPIFIYISSILILLYNGKRGKLNLKYIFYWFYPVHILVLYILAKTCGLYG